MLLHPNPVTTDRFAWVPQSRSFVAEISDLGRGFGRVYDDACDVGLTLVSRRFAGQEIVFVVFSEDRDADGDVTAWHLVAAPNQPAARNRRFAVTVLND